MTVEVRTQGPGGVATYSFDLEAVPAEVEFLLGTGKFDRLEVRAEGATTWQRVL